MMMRVSNQSGWWWRGNGEVMCEEEERGKRVAV